MDYSSFGKQFETGNYARSNLFEVRVNRNIPELQGEFNSLRFMIKAASLPGKQLGEIQAKRFGPQFKIANDVIVDQLPITVICSEGMPERNFFDAWIRNIHGDRGWESENKSTEMYRMAYYDDYVGDVEITSISKGMKETYTVQLQEAWPNNMGAVDLSWDNGEIATFTVNFTFRDWQQISRIVR